MNNADKPPEDVAQELEVPERLPEEITSDILRKYFTLTASDLEQVEQCRGPINRLGFAVQLCTLRWRGHFLGDTRQVPESVLATIASQLGGVSAEREDALRIFGAHTAASEIRLWRTATNRIIAPCGKNR